MQSWYLTFGHIYLCVRFCFFVLLVMHLIVSEAGPLCSIHKFIAAHMGRKFRLMLSCVYWLHSLTHTRTCTHVDTRTCTRYPWSEGWFQISMTGYDRGIPSPKDCLSTCLWGLVLVVIGHTQAQYLSWTLESCSSVSLNIIYSVVKKYSEVSAIKG